MKASEKKYLQEFAENIDFPTIIYLYESGNILARNAKAIEILGKDENIYQMFLGKQKAVYQEEIDNTSNVFLGRVFVTKDHNTLEVDMEINSVCCDGYHLIVLFFEQSYKQMFVKTQRAHLPRLAWKDKKCTFIGMNDSFKEDVGIGNLDIFPLRTEDTVDAITAEKLMEDDLKVIKQKKPLMNMLQLMRSDTNMGYFCSINRIPLLNRNRSCIGILGVYCLVYNREEYKQFCDDILVENSVFNRAVNASDVVVMKWKKRKHYHLEYVSTNINRYGYTIEQFYDQKVMVKDIISPDDFRMLQRNLKRIENGDSSSIEQVIKVNRPDQTYVWVKLFVGSVSLANKSIVLECFLQNITREKELERKLFEKNKEFEGEYSTAESMQAISKKQLYFQQAVEDKCNEFEVLFQPIVHLQEKRIMGVEALLRWRSKKLGDVKPKDFISMSEYMGLMRPLGEYAVNKALKSYSQLKKEIDQDIKLHINLSLFEILQPECAQSLYSKVTNYGVNPSDVVLEMKESLAIEDQEVMFAVISDLKQNGFLTALDNFGAGVASINYLQELPIDYVKLDKHLIHTYETKKFNPSLVTAILDLIDSLHLKVIAEGVETKKQYEFLLFQNVLGYQGFYYCEPVPVNDIIEMLSKSKD